MERSSISRARRMAKLLAAAAAFAPSWAVADTVTIVMVIVMATTAGLASFAVGLTSSV